MRIRYPLTLIALLLNVAISLLPGYWWYYSIGKLGIVESSPFEIYVSILGSSLLVINLVNVFLFAFRFYVSTISLYYVYSILTKGKKQTYLTITWLSYMYILDPVIIYLIFNFILASFFPAGYHFFIIGVENVTIQSGNYVITTYVQSYPTFEYFISLVVGSLNLASRLLKKY